MRTTLRFAVAGLIAVGWTTGSVNAARGAVTTVFVGPATAAQQTPRITAELTASVADLRRALKKQSSVQLVDTPEAAEVILRVQDRQRKTHLAGTESWGDSGEGGGSHSHPSYNSWARLTIELRARGLSQPMVAQAKTWKGAASRAARDVTTWIDAYRRIPTR
jgi:hypothetical protein